ncbi:cytochrome-c oxidase, cbb3-type subunit II [Aeromonas caviae]|jgi:cytochrome c oxidase cbb3-type subunit 2|uniref:Cytochrome-c oxidase, cbb3-type subunit II n=1 Tax=Aeromonas caviae TaxID=648 RepID=A0A081LQA5_AERCA|nr:MULTISPECIES: cytochrome-c oxidase, cbb3-type subunit II [Aeromonas]PZR01931.1 MAG: cytochrome-c oxidase, cbb3-type subunit II [Aeromonas media]QXW31641.1 cytochrome-c oxidase, cbb3-type subunit II [Aeromonas sanarellii]AUT40688.1 cytochrome-c oxidase, cbb3-type subunit II [Aeromonas sp. ASNIH5]AUU21049.1 cytochrome-c oxidase, cbb3-type subunit II [Aeromonas caviae]AUV12660.1 cytochrome-c oxidase, cbb3-type subunit II [Aeromonas sp. ASNIH3]
MSNNNRHEIFEKSVPMLVIGIIFAISLGGLVEITPLFFQKQTNEPVEGLKPYTALQMEGRDIYIREGCTVCHSQMIRPFRAETERYGHYSVAGESVWEHPFLWGSKRTGPDLARVGGRYSDDWHRAHLINPRDVVPESNMPAFPWLETNVLSGELTGKKLALFRDHFGVPYTDADIAGAGEAVKGKTELDALIAYLQSLGHALK